MLGQRATYNKTEVTIIGYVEWGQPLKVQYYWVMFSDGSVEKAKAKHVKTHS